MRKKISRSIMAVALTVLLLSLVFAVGFSYDYFSGVQAQQLKTELELASRGVELSGKAYLSSLQGESYRVTWLNADGTVLYDSEASAEGMENHGDREEFQEALSTGYGSSARYSSTLLRQTLYEAARLSDGTVLRLSGSRASVAGLLLSMAQPIAVILIFATVLSILLAGRMARRVAEPLNRLDLDHPLENDAYEELSPLLRRIGDQRGEIDRQRQALEASRREFAAVTQSMKEGLVLLGEKQEILSINPAAVRFLSAQPDCEGKEFLTIEREPRILRALEEVKATGWEELQLERAGRDYQLNLSGIETKGGFSGTVLLIFDVTEKMLAEQRRREFTANVSHELKTPLHAIMAGAELLENSLAKPEDVPAFAGSIRREASRLVTLIDDIIRLSRLDEGGPLPQERLDLYMLAKEETEALSPAAAEKGVALTVTGESAVVTGPAQLFREILRNLCDNAVKYNKSGGSVTVKVEPLERGAALTVSDTGIGIPPEDRDRVFERFYRVDKSRSKETGGTGLGLSIVKHAVQELGGAIALTSEVGKGTEVRVTFP